MSQPEGFKVAGKENWVCKLQKSLYGLKQSPRQWYKRFDRFMIGYKYTRSHYDHCVYFRKLQDGTFIYLLLYVDDMLIACKSKVEIERLKTQLSNEFEMKDLGEARKILGMEIERDRAKGKISLCQKQYLKKFILQAKKAMKQDMTLPLQLYTQITPYMVTDVTADEAVYLAGQALSYSFGDDDFYSMTGTVKMGEKFEEFYPDETALYELVLDVFYEEAAD